MKNSYEPKVEAKLCYSDEYLLVYFRTYEDEITARFTKTNDPVHKDSCVELFLNPFPNETNKYINFEINPIGTIHVGFGALGSRSNLPIEEIESIKIITSVQAPVVGEYGSESWKVYCQIPISLFEKYYEKSFNPRLASGNFYKCGDETKHEHYGMWNQVDAPKPNFHLPECFGDFIF